MSVGDEDSLAVEEYERNKLDQESDQNRWSTVTSNRNRRFNEKAQKCPTDEEMDQDQSDPRCGSNDQRELDQNRWSTETSDRNRRLGNSRGDRLGNSRSNRYVNENSLDLNRWSNERPQDRKGSKSVGPKS